ncbi:hypothetical protein PPSIR1_19279 [Plesiocystis pacifica SIR-1]|uniref:Uncharacterized protein n=1 Tax=Plesiocystis pacifica SIR-1 TaxID=391625 RepID=A6G821_9BACT|nr:hypothetical protein [Plesiocystis pacifica]EDM77983.1 hypothetical protein PPSIR1_19279 [Plesiocystis pacifica SIR-1]
MANKAQVEPAPESAPAATLREALEAALEALAGPELDRAAALDHLLRAWRASGRHPELAELVEALSDEALRAVDGIPEGLGNDDFHATWLARARTITPLELGALLPGMLRGPLGKAIRARFDRLVVHADDPRVLRTFGEMITEPPVMSQSNFPLWTQLFAAVEAHPDPRLVPVLWARLDRPPGRSQFWPLFYQRCLQTLRRGLGEAGLDSLTPPGELAGALGARIAELWAAAPAKATTHDSGPDEGARSRQRAARVELLFAAVHAEPERAEHRMVLADLLAAEGDPRGEFIQLQLTHARARAAGREPSPASLAREARLLAEHRDAWLGPLIEVLEEAVFSEGFLTRARAYFAAETQRGVLASPQWSTVRSLETDDLALLGDPRLRALERAGGFGGAALVGLICGQPGDAALARCATLGPVDLGADEPSEADRVRVREASGARLPALRQLWIAHVDRNTAPTPGGYAWLLDSALGRRLELLRISAHPWAQGGARGRASDGLLEGWVRALERWPALRRLELELRRWPMALVRGGGGAGPRRLEVTLSDPRTPQGRASKRELVEGLSRQLRPFLAHFDHVELRVPESSAGVLGGSREPALREALTALGCTTLRVQVGAEPGPFGPSMPAFPRWQARWREAEARQRFRRRLARSRRELAGEVRPRALARPAVPELGAAVLRHTALDAAEAAAEFVRPSYDCPGLAFTPPLANDVVLLAHLGGRVFAFDAQLRGRWLLEYAPNEWPSLSAMTIDARARLWLGTVDGAVAAWDLATGRELGWARFHAGAVSALATLEGAHGVVLVSVDEKGIVHAWPTGMGGAEFPASLLPGHSWNLRLAVSSLAVDPGTGVVFAATRSGELHRLSGLDRLGAASAALEHRRLPGQMWRNVVEVRCAPNGDHLLATTPRDVAGLWDPEAGYLGEVPQLRPGPLTWLDHERLLLLRHGRLCVHDTASGEGSEVARVSEQAAMVVALDRGRDLVATAGPTGVTLTSATGWELLASFLPEPN